MDNYRQLVILKNIFSIQSLCELFDYVIFSEFTVTDKFLQNNFLFFIREVQ